MTNEYPKQTQLSIKARTRCKAVLWANFKKQEPNLKYSKIYWLIRRHSTLYLYKNNSYISKFSQTNLDLWCASMTLHQTKQYHDSETTPIQDIRRHCRWCQIRYSDLHWDLGTKTVNEINTRFARRKDYRLLSMLKSPSTSTTRISEKTQPFGVSLTWCEVLLVKVTYSVMYLKKTEAGKH